MEWGISKQFGNSGETYFLYPDLANLCRDAAYECVCADTDTEDRNKPNFFQLVRFLSGYRHPDPGSET